MKTILLTTYMLTLSLVGFSQIIFQEDFDNIPGSTSGGAGTYAFPAGWSLRNVDNLSPDVNVSYINDAWERREDFVNNVADSAMFSTSWTSPTGTANDWAWTPVIPLSSNCILSWNAVAYDIDFPDGYEVRIMTASQGPPTGGPGVIGNQITNSTVLFSTTAENSTWTNRSVDLSAYAGQNVYIAFRNNSNDKFVLLIDDIVVEQIENYDGSIQATTDLSEYTQTPLPQSPSIPLEASVYNNGAQPLTGLTLNVDIYDATSTNVYSASSTPITLNSGLFATLNVSGYTPLTTGTFEVVYHLTATEVDQNENNDTLTQTFTISDTVYARDSGVTSGSIGIGAGTVGYIGQEFNVTVEDTLTSVSMGVTQGYTGRNYAVVIWDMVAGMPNQIIAATDTLVYPDDSADVYTLPLQGLVVLPPGQYAVTAIEFDSTLAIGLSTDIYTAGRSWVDWPGNPLGGWANFEDFGTNFARAAYLRANFGSLCSNVAVTMDTTICFGESITLGSNTYTTTGVHNAILPNGLYCDSLITLNLTVEEEVTPTIIDTTICFGETFTVGANTYTSTGNYTEYIPNGTCDSIVMTTLTVTDEIITDISVSTDLTTITAATTTGATYQWVDCDTGLAIAGETDTSYTVATAGNYAVIINIGECTDTSECAFASDAVGTAELVLTTGFAAFPNPATEQIHVVSEEGGNYVLTNEIGQVLITLTVEPQVTKTVSVEHLGSGMYFLQDTTTKQLIKLIIR